MNSEFPQTLLFALFEGRATPLQKKLVREWLLEPANREAFCAALETYETEHPQYQADAEAGFRRFRAEFDEPVMAPAHRPKALRLRLGWGGWLVAASVVLLIGLGFGWRESVFQLRYETAFGQTRTLLLPDGSRVVLNANSTLRVPRFGFGHRTREVRLDGEAEFSVVHTQTHQPFVVKTARDLDVVVLGTEFTVFSRPRASKVVLKRGKVRLNYAVRSERRQLTLKPGDVMTLDPEGRARLQTTRRPETHSAWKDRRVVFEETPLSEIVQIFEETYGIHLELPDAGVARLTLSGAFTASDADELIRTVTDALGLGFRREGNTIYLTPSASD